MKPDSFFPRWYAMQITLYHVTSKNALSTPVTFWLHNHCANSLARSIINPHFYLITFVSLYESCKLLYIFENSRPTHIIQCFIQHLLILSCQNEILSSLKRFYDETAARLFGYETFSGRAPVHMHNFQNLIMCILIVFIADSDPKHISLDVHLFNLLSQLILQHLKFFAIIFLFCRLNFDDQTVDKLESGHIT